MKDLLETDDVEEGIEGNRKLLGRILIKGDANITSASISRDGSILVVSTSSSVKAFHLKTITGLKEELKISKIDVPTSISDLGATKVQISPDSRWLCLTPEGSKSIITKILHDGTPDEKHVAIYPRPTKLVRLRRDIKKHTRLGGLGSYDRRITHVAFSPDSEMLATADLAGYLDTWVLRDTGLQNGGNSTEEGDASSSSASDGSSDEEQEVESGPRWIRNPKASLIPKLITAPVVLSFSEEGLRARGDGEEEDYTLLAITTASRVYTFHPLEGAMTKWSRRNTLHELPEEIRATRDLIKGVVWQGSRIWLYGNTFLFMLDTSLDFAEEASATALTPKKGTKRKRGGDTGAGSKMEVGALGPQHMRVALAKGGKKGEWVDVEMADAQPGQESSGDMDDEDEDDDEEGGETDGGELQKLRRSKQNGDAVEASQRRKWWHTYKYRPILGVVPLEEIHGAGANGVTNGVNGNSQKSTELPPLEVALVERPLWDVDLPPRYVEDE